jgi:hypothetical protein
MLYIDGNYAAEAVNANPGGANTITLSAGLHTVRYLWLNQGTAALANFRYSGPDTNFVTTVIPGVTTTSSAGAVAANIITTPGNVILGNNNALGTGPVNLAGGSVQGGFRNNAMKGRR